jgi:nucleosome assembly protein 1-like 1
MTCGRKSTRTKFPCVRWAAKIIVENKKKYQTRSGSKKKKESTKGHFFEDTDDQNILPKKNTTTMSEPIRKKINQLASAPTPQNTPASLTSSYLKNNPLIVPSTIDEEAEIKKNLSNNPAFLSMIQGKLGTLVGRDSGYIDALSPNVKNRIYSLKAVQKEQMKLEEEFQRELLELEKKFAKKYEPFFKRRSDIISGNIEPTEEEVETGKEIERELGADEDEDEDNKLEEIREEEEGEKESAEEEVRGIPDFWLTALENLTYVSQTITERDQEVLSFLTDVRLEYLEKPGFRLVFEFAENPFFKNSKLSKTYYYQEELGYSGDFIYDHAEGDVIEWTSAKQNVTVSIERRRQRNKQTQQTRTIEKVTPEESFFNFFDPPKAPADEDEEEDEFDEEELEARLALDYQLGEELKDKLIPRAIDWFTGSAVDYEGDEEEFGAFDEEDEEDDEEEDEDDDDEDDEDDDDDDEDEESAAKKGKQPPECKQT